MWTIFETEVTKIKDGKKFTSKDEVIREVKLTIFVNQKRIGAMMSVPVDLKELTVGYLISENIITDVQDISKLEIIDKDGEQKNFEAIVQAEVIDESLDRLDLEGVIVSGCGRGASTHISPVAIDAQVMRDDFSIEASLLFKEMSKFYGQCPLYEQTGCVHTAKVYFDEETYFIGEDIAQHNTIDKAVGKARLAGIDVSKCFLMVSGRLSSEMVAKAVMHQIPILASRTASTCRGVNIADKFGLTLIGFVRGERMNIYRNPRRINV
ncbi:formate dehydrogenase accessory sulfurtransferase FdhD [Sulfurovum sp. ST-21]|uniref:Sulfur carrier protein FdhD n=1 Tax=Sulfurovum indicum TaxID=2779528 RepID=A0A7M1S4H5_9BACT|nr:formate dehydrogenase accessory sulfurtransferase FdhD [Sulfurovum indicum]QOR61260.1 formate dehydrogenase accessory sulfurtransferase FdhD [Sulfurovum indicum]